MNKVTIDKIIFIDIENTELSVQIEGSDIKLVIHDECSFHVPLEEFEPFVQNLIKSVNLLKEFISNESTN